MSDFRSESFRYMLLVVLFVLAAFVPWVAFAEPCPAGQDSSVDLSDGAPAVLCVRSTPEAPAASVELSFEAPSWDANGQPAPVVEPIVIDKAPAGSVYADGTRFTVEIPSSLRGVGVAKLQAFGPNGEASEVVSPEIRFRALQPPVAPSLGR